MPVGVHCCPLILSRMTTTTTRICPCVGPICSNMYGGTIRPLPCIKTRNGIRLLVWTTTAIVRTTTTTMDRPQQQRRRRWLPKSCITKITVPISPPHEPPCWIGWSWSWFPRHGAPSLSPNSIPPHIIPSRNNERPGRRCEPGPVRSHGPICNFDIPTPPGIWRMQRSRRIPTNQSFWHRWRCCWSGCARHVVPAWFSSLDTIRVIVFGIFNNNGRSMEQVRPECGKGYDNRRHQDSNNMANHAT